MPVKLLHEVRRLDEQEFGRIAYEVMGCVFQMHRDLGRFFDEDIYKRELCRRLPQTEFEFPVEVSFDPFRKRYFLDVLVDGGAAFEFKAVETLADRHRSQLLNYLLLCGLSHGKLINVRPPAVEHEFVNTTLTLEDRTRFEVDAAGWIEVGNLGMRSWLTGLLRDLGTGLDLELYEDALTQFCGGRERVTERVEITSGSRILGTQQFRLVQPGVAFKVTTLDGDLSNFTAHATRLLAHARLDAIQWININRQRVTFRTLRRSKA